MAPPSKITSSPGAWKISVIVLPAASSVVAWSQSCWSLKAPADLLAVCGVHAQMKNVMLVAPLIMAKIRAAGAAALAGPGGTSCLHACTDCGQHPAKPCCMLEQRMARSMRMKRGTAFTSTAVPGAAAGRAPARWIRGELHDACRCRGAGSCTSQAADAGSLSYADRKSVV